MSWVQILFPQSTGFIKLPGLSQFSLMWDGENNGTQGGTAEL